MRHSTILAVGALLVSGQAAAQCADANEVISGFVNYAWAPNLVTLEFPSGTVQVAMQRVRVSTSIDPSYDIAGRPHDNLEVLVCDHQLDPTGQAVPCENAGLGTTVGWRVAYWQNRFNQTPGPAPASPPAAPIGMWSIGSYRPNEGLPWQHSSPTRFHTFLASKVQAAEPACGRQLRLGWVRPNRAPPLWTKLEDTDRILNNPSQGLVTQHIAGEAQTTGIGMDRKASYAERGAQVCWLHTTDFRKPGSTAWAYEPAGLDDQDNTAHPGQLFGSTANPNAPQPTITAKVPWDFLWHGTCPPDVNDDGVAEGAARVWCLPDDHRRLSRDLRIDALQGTLSASSCLNNTCDAACPTAAGGPTEAKYDFAVLETATELAWESGPQTDTMVGECDFDSNPATVNAGQPYTIDFGLRQRMVIHIAMQGPGELVNRADGIFPAEFEEGDWQTPDFFTACANLAQEDGTAFRDVDGDEVYDVPFTWRTAAYNDADMIAQHGLLMDALANGGANTDPAALYAPFNGFANDQRVSGIDVGIGTWGEFNQSHGNDPDFEAVAGYGQFRAAGFDFSTDTDYQHVGSGVNGTCATQTEGPEGAWWKHYFDQYSAAFDVVPTSSTDPAWANDKSLVTRLHFNTGAVNNTGGCYTPSTYSSTSTVNAAGDPIAPYGMGRAMAGFLYAGLERTGYADVACPGCDDENLACKIAAGCDFDESWAANNRTNLLADLAGRTDWQRSPYFVETYYELPALVDGVRAEGTIRYFDLDESVRFAVSNHLSMFNMKNAFIPAGDRILATGLVQDPAQGGLPLGWCDCDASGSDNCVVRQVERLLVETGQRLSISTMSWRAGRIGQPLAVGVDLRNRGNAPPYHHARPAVRLVRNGTPGAWVLADASARDVLPPPLKCVPSWADRTTQACVDDLDFSNSPTAWPYACNTIGEAEATPRVTRLLFTVPATAISAAGAHTLQFAWLDAAGAPGAVDMAMAPDATGAWYTLGNVTVTN